MEGLPDWLKPELLWFLIGLVLLLAEFAIPGLLIFFFGLGAWLVALICFMLDIDLTLQLFIFLVSSVLFLVLFRRRLKSLFYDKAKFANLENSLEEFKGRHVRVVREIEPMMKGKVEFNGTHWDAEADVPIDVGTIVEIIDKENITLKVKPI